MGEDADPPAQGPAGRFRWAWTLTVEHEDAEALARALAPESQDHHKLDVEDGRLVARGRGSTGESLHTVDDLLACLTAAAESLEAGGGS